MGKFKFIETKTTTVEVDVEFPIYHQHDVGGDDYSAVIYSRIDQDSDGMVVWTSIHKTIYYRSKNISWEIDEKKSHNLSGEKDYCLGLGQYASSRESFENVLIELKEVVSSI